MQEEEEEGECELPKRGGVFLTYKGGTGEHLQVSMSCASSLAEAKLACSPHGHAFLSGKACDGERPPG